MHATDWVARLCSDRPFTPESRDLKISVHRTLLEQLDPGAIGDEVRTAVAQLAFRVLEDSGRDLGVQDRERLAREVRDEFFGLGPLEPLLEDPQVSDILVNGAETVYVEKRGQLELTPVCFKDNDHLRRVIERIVQRVGRRIDEQHPLVDARLPDGSRVNAVIPPVAVDGPSLSIRRFGRRPLAPQDLVSKFTLTDSMLQFLEGAIRARLNIIISGGTGSGKTTLLNALSSYIPDRERIVTVEDAAELRLQQRHVVRLETRPSDMNGNTAVHIRHLVINALRMRPDRIVVGEVRSEEALDMLQAMNTGHDGSLTTVHANSPRDALTRLEVMVGMANANLGVRVMRQQISSALNLIVQAARLSDGSRKVTHITECLGMETDVITLQDIFVFERTGVNKEGKVTGRFRGAGLRPRACDRLKTAGMDLPQSIFQTNLAVN